MDVPRNVRSTASSLRSRFAACSQQCSNISLIHESGKTSICEKITSYQLSNFEILIRVEAVWVGELEIALTSGRLKCSGPRVPGENFCGVIVGRGLEVDYSVYKLNDRVAVESRHFCNDCFHCDRGQSHLCVNGRHFGWSVDGGYQQFVVVQQQHVHPFDRSLDFEHACLCPVVANVSFGLTKASINPGDSVLILGSSERALVGVILSRCLGADCVLVAGRPGDDAAAPLRCGASRFVPFDEAADPAARRAALLAECKEVSAGRGVDVVLYPGPLAGGLPLLSLALACVRQGGCLVSLIGWADVAAAADPLAATAATRWGGDGLEAALGSKDVRVVNVSGSSSAMFEQALRWLEGGLVDVGSLVTRTQPLSRWEDAHALISRLGFAGAVLLPHPPSS